MFLYYFHSTLLIFLASEDINLLKRVQNIMDSNQGRTHVEAGCGLGHTRFFNFFLIYTPRQQKKEKKKKAVTSYFEYEVDH
jgi:hypothetical protein